MLSRRRLLQGAGSLVFVRGAIHTASAYAESYPSKPITLVMPVAAGNGADVVARVLATYVSKQIGQPIVVDNRPGAAGIAAVKYAASAPPDGYTLVLTGTGNALSQSLYKAPPYDLLRDLTPIANFARTEVAILVSKQSKINNIKDLVQLAREKKDRMSVGITVFGTVGHLMAELFKVTEKLPLTIVPFKTSTNLHSSLVSGDVDFAFDLVPAALPLIQGSRLKAIAVNSGARSAVLPDVPTLKESGMPNYDFASYMQIGAPAGTPAPIVDRLNKEIQQSLARPDLQQKFRDMGFSVESGSPGETRQHIAGEIERWRNLIRLTQIDLQ